MDFSKLGSARKSAPSADPIRIFESLPSLSGTVNDLWRGQGKALADWNTSRDKADVLVSLNTGAGKTIVGLLIAQSLVNEGIGNVLYVCSTIDLVMQTSDEASSIGLGHTTRVRRSFSNDLFETGKSFCITTYAALFNGHSAIRNRFFPGAVIFDDAHVAENLLRGAFTIRVDVREREALFSEIANLFASHFDDLGAAGRFRDAMDLSRLSTAFVAPRGLFERSGRLLEILLRHGLKDDQELSYPFAWLEDHLDACSAIFTAGVFELAPPFLPSLALDVFQQRIRRVYLSATLESQTDFIRAFGRLPDVSITPSNDAGNGERLVVDGRGVMGGFGPDFVRDLVIRRKVVIAVPSYERAGPWAAVTKPPSVQEFSEKLDEFREASSGAFVLVSRVDGIDLPHDTCRIMVIDGLPSGTSLLERYQWEFLYMHNIHAVKLANRLAQLFGRINRGRNDHGVFLVQGGELGKWLANDRHLALLPPLLQKQILIGREVQAEFGIHGRGQAVELVDRVLGRDQGWLDYYQREVKMAELDADQLRRHREAEPAMVAAALSEARYAAAMWRGDPATARQELDTTIDATAECDTPLGGWHAVWLGAAYDREGDRDAASRAYVQAARRLGSGIALPRAHTAVAEAGTSALNSFGWSLRDLVGVGSGGKYSDELGRLRTTLSHIDAGSPNQAEAAVRALGELLGFDATRPDNDEGTGPDVLWRDPAGKLQVGFELKTDKASPATYYKRDISQAHDHLTWMSRNHPGDVVLGLAFLGPDGTVHSKANPSAAMSLCLPLAMAALRDDVLALAVDIRRRPPVERFIALSAETSKEQWRLRALLQRLGLRSLA